MTNNNEDKPEVKLRDLVSHEKLNIGEEEVPVWSLGKEQVGTFPLTPEDKPEVKLKDLVSHEKLNLVEEEVPAWSISREDLGLSPLPPEDKPEVKLKDLVSHEKLNLVEEEVPAWSISREEVALPPLTPEDKPEVKLKDLVSHEKLNLVEEEVPVWSLNEQTNTDGGIFSTGGTDFSKVLSNAIEDMSKVNPDSPKNVVMITDGENGSTIESLTTTTYNEEQKKKALREMPETEFKEERKTSLSERIKNVNASLSADNKSNGPKLK